MYSGWPLLARENENSLLLFNPHQSGVKGGTAFPCSLPLIIAFFKQVRINFCHPKHHRVLLQHRSLLIHHQLLPVSLHWAETGWIVWISVLEAFIPGVLTPIKPFQEETRTGAALGGNKSSHPALAGCHRSRPAPHGATAPAQNPRTVSHQRRPSRLHGQQQPETQEPTWAFPHVGLCNRWLSLLGWERWNGSRGTSSCSFA